MYWGIVSKIVDSEGCLQTFLSDYLHWNSCSAVRAIERRENFAKEDSFGLVFFNGKIISDGKKLGVCETVSWIWKIQDLGAAFFWYYMYAFIIEKEYTVILMILLSEDAYCKKVFRLKTQMLCEMFISLVFISWKYCRQSWVLGCICY